MSFIRKVGPLFALFTCAVPILHTFAGLPFCTSQPD